MVLSRGKREEEQSVISSTGRAQVTPRPNENPQITVYVELSKRTIFAPADHPASSQSILVLQPVVFRLKHVKGQPGN